MILFWDERCASGECGHCDFQDEMKFNVADDVYDDGKGIFHYHSISVEGETLVKCYTELLKQSHQIFICQRCKRYMHNKVNDEFNKKEYCDECTFHSDFYSITPDKVQKCHLFDCFICGEERIDIRFKAALTCGGQGQHTDFLCNSCFIKNKKKCPVCRR
jgi:superfamily II helicase